MDNRKKADNTRKDTAEAEEIEHAKVTEDTVLISIDWTVIPLYATNHRIYGKPLAPLKAFGRLQLTDVTLDGASDKWPGTYMDDNITLSSIRAPPPQIP